MLQIVEIQNSYVQKECIVHILISKHKIYADLQSLAIPKRLKSRCLEVIKTQIKNLNTGNGPRTGKPEAGVS